MPTKTQAQKRQEKQEKQKKAADLRQQSKEATAAAIQKQIKETENNKNQDETIHLTKRERRKLVKKETEKPSLELLGSSSTNRIIMSDLVSNKEKNAILDLVEENVRSENKQSHDASRLVENHSTYCDGLRPVLTRLQTKLSGCTIIPGEISQTNTHTEIFELRFQRKLDDHSFKFVARNGRTAQDVSISVEDKYIKIYQEDRIQEIINEVLSQNSENTGEDSVDLSLSYGIYNRAIPLAQRALQREKHKQVYIESKQNESVAKKMKEIANIKREIRNKDIGATSAQAIAEHFYAIEKEGAGGKHAYGKHSYNGLKGT